MDTVTFKFRKNRIIWHTQVPANFGVFMELEPDELGRKFINFYAGLPWGPGCLILKYQVSKASLNNTTRWLCNTIGGKVMPSVYGQDFICDVFAKDIRQWMRLNPDQQVKISTFQKAWKALLKQRIKEFNQRSTEAK